MDMIYPLTILSLSSSQFRRKTYYCINLCIVALSKNQPLKLAVNMRLYVT